MTRLLLDTNVFLWIHTAPHRLGKAQTVLLDPDNELYLSAASAWEIAIKYSLAKLPLPKPPAAYVPEYSRKIGARSLPVSEADALGVAALPLLHGDPFDRLLVAQAQTHGMTIVTGDPKVTQYGVASLAV